MSRFQVSNLATFNGAENFIERRGLDKFGVGVLVVAAVVALFGDSAITRLSAGYLVAFMFFLSISLGAMFFVILHHLVGSTWSVAIRRVAELLMAPITLLGVLSLPILVPLLLGGAELYSWNNAELRVTDPLVAGKTPYLNAPFFVLRCMFYFAAWAGIAAYFSRLSRRQDEVPGPELTERMRRSSGPAMLAFAATVNFAAFDLLMSLDSHWFSSIFGIYFFAGCAVAIFATLRIVLFIAQRYGRMCTEVTVEHYHDLGKLLFGFTCFWGYIAFSQYILIWYANIPEETFWYAARQKGVWAAISLALILGHFVLPFFGMMSRKVRRNRTVLVGWACVLLAMHWVDLIWLVLPSVKVEPGIVQLLCFIGLGSLWIATVLREMASSRLVPLGDPSLPDSIRFHAE